ncbi:hypothetical protein [Haloarcula salinisoli]|uniref:Uncharacterized protein n=1 Tax=Haloarcula salinisoli TaxID=2487746 RepID=A0A8J7YB13_9EURY|nr:hypothetical protein [Halomicroarcula salinisoli]MBX0285861.1 hypothetical protein [Halomicroarcula salinisoli]MBX0302645.1 hypothetical protein [Halomicroarcula salinisoli]
MVLKTGAAVLAERRGLPTALRSVLGYYADTGVFDYSSLSLKSEIDERTERMLDDVYDRIEDALAEEFGHPVDFSYDTKLILPARLTLGYVYRAARQEADTDPVGDDIATGVPPVEDAALDGESPTLTPREQVVRAEQMTRLSIEALVDGDMRDAINDAEFEDFEVEFGEGDHREPSKRNGERSEPWSPSESDRRRVAEVAQETLQSHLDGLLADLPDSVAEAYQWAVDYSEAHQDRDDHFRELMERAEAGDEEAMEAIRAEYKFADYEEPPATLSADEQALPYSKTQYARVGVIYDGMLDLYRLAGLDIDDDFAKAIVLAIIGAQVWLDDVDDYADDRAEGQLTPVTAEYLLRPDDRAAYYHVVDITEQYLDLAKEYATAADSPLTGVAVEYIYRSGDPSVLPGHR